MVLDLIAVCYLTARIVFIVPEGWTVTEVYSGGKEVEGTFRTAIYCDAACEIEKSRPRIKLKRTMNEGDVVRSPEGCSVEIRNANTD